MQRYIKLLKAGSTLEIEVLHLNSGVYATNTYYTKLHSEGLFDTDASDVLGLESEYGIVYDVVINGAIIFTYTIGKDHCTFREFLSMVLDKCSMCPAIYDTVLELYDYKRYLSEKLYEYTVKVEHIKDKIKEYNNKESH